MAELFEITKINHLVLENRFIRSATWEAKASKAGSVTPELGACAMLKSDPLPRDDLSSRMHNSGSVV